VLDARGKDARGNGTAAAKVTAKLIREGTGTRVEVLTDLSITGKPAQFGRGVMVDVGNKLIGQFADCLAGKLAASDEPSHATGAAAAQPADEAVGGVPATSAPVPAPRPEPEPINLMASAGPALAKRLTPVVAGVAALVALVLVLRRRRG
jgi:uncharacterized protein